MIVYSTLSQYLNILKAKITDPVKSVLINPILYICGGKSPGVPSSDKRFVGSIIGNYFISQGKLNYNIFD